MRSVNIVFVKNHAQLAGEPSPTAAPAAAKAYAKHRLPLRFTSCIVALGIVTAAPAPFHPWQVCSTPAFPVSSVQRVDGHRNSLLSQAYCADCVTLLCQIVRLNGLGHLAPILS